MLSALASVSYVVMWTGGSLVLIALPMLKAFGWNGFYYGLELPVTAPTLQTMVQTVAGPAPLAEIFRRGTLLEHEQSLVV